MSRSPPESFFIRYARDAAAADLRFRLRCRHRLLPQRLHSALAAREVHRSATVAMLELRTSARVVRECADLQLDRLARPVSLLRRMDQRAISDHRADCRDWMGSRRQHVWTDAYRSARVDFRNDSLWRRDDGS